MKDPYGIHLRSAPPTAGVAPALQAPSGGCGDQPPPVRSSEVWHSPSEVCSALLGGPRQVWDPPPPAKVVLSC